MAHPHDPRHVYQGGLYFSQAVGSLMHNKTSRLLAYHSVFSDFSFPKSRKTNTRHGEEKGPIKPWTLETGKGSGSGNIGSSEISMSHLHNVVSSGRPGPYLKTVSKGKEAEAKKYIMPAVINASQRKQSN